MACQGRRIEPAHRLRSFPPSDEALAMRDAAVSPRHGRRHTATHAQQDDTESDKPADPSEAEEPTAERIDNRADCQSDRGRLRGVVL